MAFRKPRRVTITIPHATYLALERRSYEQGRSLSNLSAYLLECAVNEPLPLQPLLPLSPSRVSRDGHLSR
ncbi:MAG: ribbon-helix-helix domain-containing protein [bacterium]